MATSEYQVIAQQAQQLSLWEQLRLISQLVENLTKTSVVTQPRYLVYGEFHDTPGREFSTEEDFKLAEWHPTEEDLNGD